jgi:hypothetical protein
MIFKCCIPSSMRRFAASLAAFSKIQMLQVSSATTPNSGNYVKIQEWSKEQVADWIAGLGFSNYRRQFEQINGNQLVSLTNEILKNV